MEFQKFKVSRLDHLHKGDQITVKRGRRPGYKHHMIVEEKPTDLTKVQVIEYGSGKGKLWRPVVQIRRSNKNLCDAVTRDKVRRIDYDPEKCQIYTPDKTVERAQSKLGERGYRLVTNNCEHFATWCKTGKPVSTQVNKVISPAVSSRTRSASHKRKRDSEPDQETGDLPAQKRRKTGGAVEAASIWE